MFRKIGALIVGLGLAVSASAQPEGGWQAGKHYFPIEPAQATTTGDKVEVAEVFSYACPHCNQVAPIVESLKKNLPANAGFVMIPAQFGFDAWKTFARGFYTAQALGFLEKSHMDMFKAIYVDKKIDSGKPTIEALASFYSQYGVSAEDFLATSKSFAIETKLKRNASVTSAYGVEGTPAFIVNGKYRISGQSAGGYDQLEPLIKFLIEKESSGG
jgi:thiol:disulfide interchange protein DsbA